MILSDNLIKHESNKDWKLKFFNPTASKALCQTLFDFWNCGYSIPIPQSYTCHIDILLCQCQVQLVYLVQTSEKSIHKSCQLRICQQWTRLKSKIVSIQFKNELVFVATFCYIEAVHIKVFSMGMDGSVRPNQAFWGSAEPPNIRQKTEPNHRIFGRTNW